VFSSIVNKNTFLKAVSFAVLLSVWQLVALHYHSELLLPSPMKTGEAFIRAVMDISVLENLLVTLKRVVFGLCIALAIGLPLGFAMGGCEIIMKLINPVVGPIRQVPMMAWVPLTIIWFGLGEGPTLFLITFVGVFPILLNTIAGVQSIPKNYYNAAFSMGSSALSAFFSVTVPATLPHIVTGLRLALCAGWMSVICAEFIATSSGFGFAMVRAQTMMDTPLLIALMIMGAIIGYGMDHSILLLERKVAQWRFIQ
jgi:NitT/TauT family transport system permease protein